jgi:two-component system cell cycle response regulator DivK
LKHHILVVEDNPVNRELLCEWLEPEGYEVTSAEDLKAGFAALQSHQPHALLLDIQLGAEDGTGLVSCIRQQPALREIPVIGVTAHAMTTERRDILQAGCNACISKPIDFKVLQDQLDGLLAISARQPLGRSAEASGPQNKCGYRVRFLSWKMTQHCAS